MSAPATPAARLLASGRFEATTILRNGEQLLVSIVLPLMALVLLTYAPYPVLDGSRIDVVAPGALSLAVVSTAFTGQAISTGFDRRYGVLRLLGVTPLGREGLLAGKALAVLAVLVIQAAVLGTAAFLLGWRPQLGGLVPLAITLVCGAGCFVALALLVAGAMRAEAVLAVANLLWIVFLGLGLVLPSTTLPDPVATVAAWSPSGLLGDAARAATLEGTWARGSWVLLLLWAAAGAVLARASFRWSD